MAMITTQIADRLSVAVTGHIELTIPITPVKQTDELCFGKSPLPANFLGWYLPFIHQLIHGAFLDTQKISSRPNV